MLMSRNDLYPIFLRPGQFRLLLVGAGYVGFEKLSFLMKSSPQAKVLVVAPEISADVRALAADAPGVELQQKVFEPADLNGIQWVIAGTALPEVNLEVYRAAKAANVLVNVADTPELCDFYLGSIVTKGDLKIAISTNGKSPTFAKRFREMLEEVLPESIHEILSKLAEIRAGLKGDFSQKIAKLDEITEVLKGSSSTDKTPT